MAQPADLSTRSADMEKRLGMVVMCMAMVLLPLGDAISKALTSFASPFEVTVWRTLAQALFFLPAALILRRHFSGSVFSLGSLLSAALILVVMICLVTAFATMPIATAIAIFFVEPLILTILSALFLGEKVGWHRSSAVAVGLVGALIVIRPNFAMFGWAAMLPLLAAFTFAGVMTTLRAMPAAIDTVRIQTFCGGFAALVLGVAMLVGHFLQVKLFTFVPPTTNEWLILVAVGVVATIAQAMFTLAARFAQASLLAPFQYLEIVMATVYGYFIFDEFPDALTWLGTAIILAAGLYVVHRERRLARARARLRQMPLG